MQGSAYRSVAVLILLTALALVPGCKRDEQTVQIPTSVRNEPTPPPLPHPPVELLATQQAFSGVAARTTPAVVNISAARLARGRAADPLFDDFFGEFFPGQRRAPRQEQSLGSGVIISRDGYILTNAHVVEGAGAIRIRLSDATTYEGRLIGVDPRTDVAVIKIDAREPLSAAVLGDSDKLRVGEWALAIGNPFGLDRTVTVGVISAIGRADVGIEDYEDFIQTDASINPGNSGGPLLNIYGEVVGINTAIVASGQGIGFAIPINLARLISGQLIEHGEVTRGWLGISVQPLTAELAASFGLKRSSGALINQVFSDSPAAAAGLKPGDVLLRLAGKEVRGVRELQLLVASTPVGQSVTLDLLRDGKELSLAVTIVAQPRPPATRATRPKLGGDTVPSTAFGLTVGANPKGVGVLVVRVDPESNAAAAGVEPGDLILAVNHQEIGGLQDFSRAARANARTKQVLLLLQRDQTMLYLAFPH